MPAQILQILNIYANLAIIIFVLYYFWSFRSKEKELKKKEGKIDGEYHQIVDTALAKERKILEDATTEADQIIAGAKHATQASEEAVNQALHQMVTDIQKEATDTSNEISNSNKSSEEEVTDTLKKMVTDVQKETNTTAHGFTTAYQASLKQLSDQSLNDFQSITKKLEDDLQKQIKEFRETLLPNLEKELEAYKQARLKQTERTVTSVVQKVSQQVLNKSIPLEDHQALLIESLEKAKREGMFS